MPCTCWAWSATGGCTPLLSHLEALIAAAEAAGVERIYIHAFLDGRDTPPDSGAGYLKPSCRTF